MVISFLSMRLRPMLKKNSQLNLNRFGIWNGKQITIPNLKTKKNHRIGFLTKDRVFIMHRRLERKFRIYDGWGLNKEVLLDLSQKFCREIRMFVWDTLPEPIGRKKIVLKYILVTTPEKWLSKGIPYLNEKLNNEFQLILNEANFDKKIVCGVEIVK